MFCQIPKSFLLSRFPFYFTFLPSRKVFWILIEVIQILAVCGLCGNGILMFPIPMNPRPLLPHNLHQSTMVLALPRKIRWRSKSVLEGVKEVQIWKVNISLECKRCAKSRAFSSVMDLRCHSRWHRCWHQEECGLRSPIILDSVLSSMYCGHQLVDP